MTSVKKVSISGKELTAPPGLASLLAIRQDSTRGSRSQPLVSTKRLCESPGKPKWKNKRLDPCVFGEFAFPKAYYVFDQTVGQERQKYRFLSYEMSVLVQHLENRPFSSLKFVLLNLLTILAFALLHPYSSPADLLTEMSYSAYCCWIVFECFLLFSPALCAFLIFSLIARRHRQMIVIAITLAISAIYFIDFTVFIYLQEHLISSVFWDLVLSVLPFLHSYLNPSQFFWISLAGVGWCVVQWSLWRASNLPSKSRADKNDLGYVPTAILIGISLLPIALSLLPALTNWNRTVSEILSASDRHPLTASGFFAANNAPKLQLGSMGSLRGQAQMIDQSDRVKEFIDRYNLLRSRRRVPGAGAPTSNQLAEGSSRPPDVMLVIVECLRPDAITSKSSPNLHAMKQKGLWMQQHYSTGHNSPLGFFGAMYGLDACWYDHRGEMKNALFRCFKEQGYETALFGLDGFESFGMEKFCGKAFFDYCELFSWSDLIACDQNTCRAAADFFNRSGKYSTRTNAPRIAIVYIYGTHDSIHLSEDALHTADDSRAMPDGERRDAAKFARFLNGIHFFDRIIAPLINKERVTFVIGDHGESFGEDRRYLHGSALSKVQLQTFCLGFGPGVPALAIDVPTSHVDILPTIADAVGIHFSDSGVLSGTSLLQPIPKDQWITCHSFTSHNVLCIPRDRVPESNTLGYQGFFHWKSNTMAPGSMADIFGDRISEVKENDRNWSTKNPLLQWASQRFGDDFGSVPENLKPLLYRNITHPNPAFRLQVISIIRDLGAEALEFEGVLRHRLADPDKDVRESSFSLLHSLKRQ